MDPNQIQSQPRPLRDIRTLTRHALSEGAIAQLGEGYVSDIALSPDGKYLAVGTRVGVWWYERVTMSAVDLWDTEQGAISTLSFSPNGEWLATAGQDGCVKVWDVSHRTCLTRIERWEKNSRLTRQDKISCIAFSSDSQQLAVSGQHDYIVDIWHPKTGERLAKINGDYHQVELWQYCSLERPVAFSPDSQLLACLTPHIQDTTIEPEAESVSVWALSNGECIASLTQYPSGFPWYSFCFSPCGETLVASGGVSLWDMKPYLHRHIVVKPESM